MAAQSAIKKTIDCPWMRGRREKIESLEQILSGVIARLHMAFIFFSFSFFNRVDLGDCRPARPSTGCVLFMVSAICQRCNRYLRGHRRPEIKYYCPRAISNANTSYSVNFSLFLPAIKVSAINSIVTQDRIVKFIHVRNLIEKCTGAQEKISISSN